MISSHSLWPKASFNSNHVQSVTHAQKRTREGESHRELFHFLRFRRLYEGRNFKRALAGAMAFGVVAVAVDTLPSRCPLLLDSALSYARRPPPQITSSFLAACWHLRRRHRPASSPSLAKKQQQQGRSRRRGGLLVVVDELAGQYDEGFEDVHVVINQTTHFLI